MRTNRQSNICVAVIGSVTQAMQAKKALLARGISAELIKADSTKTRYGCAYAVSYSCFLEPAVREVLGAEGISIRSFYKGDWP